jgi:nuclear autoantigenic sperm protein
LCASEEYINFYHSRARHYGDLALECAFTYYKYGCALLYKAQSEADPLCEVKEIDEEDAPSNTTEEAGV